MEVVQILKDLLYDLNYSQADLKEFVRAKGRCVECCEYIKLCECCKMCGDLYCCCDYEEQTEEEGEGREVN